MKRNKWKLMTLLQRQIKVAELCGWRVVPSVIGSKIKMKFTKEQFKKLLRPMFVSTIMFGYATEEMVEKAIDDMLNIYAKGCDNEN